MPRYEYKVVPAPTKGLKAKNVKGAEARFSHALQELMNGLSGYGWEYQRAETMPSIERAGLTGSTTEWRNVLVFRRLANAASQPDDTDLLPSPAVAATPALAATIEGDDTALQADAPASITPEDGAPVKEEPAEVATPPAFLSDTPAKEGSEASSPGKTDEE